jgi:thiamine-monophosphate kinase
VGPPKPRQVTRLVEDEMVDSIRSVLGSGIEAFGLRDDAGVVAVPGGGSMLVSVDSVVDGVHVDLTLCTPADMGWKAVSGALSDLAAMGSSPFGALVALCVPDGSGEGELALGIMSGVAEASVASGCPVVGGDVSSATTALVAVTVLGTVPGDGAPVARSGGAPGDAVFVTGPCGGSAACLRMLRESARASGASSTSGTSGASSGCDAGSAYCRPAARLREGDLARRVGAHAMIDVSDGLALDLHRLADASGVGFRLDDVPVVDGATLEEALGGGEDYELVFAVSSTLLDDVFASFAEAGLRSPEHIGTLVADPVERTLRGRPLDRLGWQHSLG